MDIRRVAGAVLLALCIGGPIAELFDGWDHTFQDGNDTEANVVMAALCVGMALAVATTVVVNRIRAVSSALAIRPAVQRPVHPVLCWVVTPRPTSSPPAGPLAPLRI